ncbi:conserved hypothetical protein [Pirellula staleyi DSM 6068]|uniref:Probable sensor domain-containing protein n=1 Tax=Pirellula staleyi (strain ATCC 27377 / DSM 6068 / ICPB 4128) TaxID=530564 RepID=D2R5H4_PIRSD|nr:hypothetical protein [Pirellula staleyi]ADB15433.1 conserved hypothetical protein [Pirellula staleyi DSM 6068]
MTEPLGTSLYPPDLAEEVKKRWAIADHPAHCLPDPASLSRFLDVSYQASLLREEGELVRCRLIYGSPQEFLAWADRAEELVVLEFDHACPLSPHEIRKLASAAAIERSLLGVELRDDQLVIWGLILTGTRWINRMDGGRYLGQPLPSNLVIQILGPGHLVIASGHERVVENTSSLLLSQGFDPFHSKWLPAKFREARATLVEQLPVHEQMTPTTRICDSFVKMAAQSIIRRTLNLVRQRKHGGMLVYLPRETIESDMLHQWFRFRVMFCQEDSTLRFRTVMKRLLSRLLVLGSEQNLSVVTWEDYQRIQDPELASLDESLVEFAHLLADLMSVDGTLVLNREFQLIGFGGEILGDLHVLKIHRARDLEATETVVEPADASGTRHRSAYRLVLSLPDALAVVVSQDGAIRFVAHHEGKLTYWPYLP